MATDEQPGFRVNGRIYPVPDDLTLGEMCDAERYFGVEFGEQQSSGMRMMAALLWIAIRREDPSVEVEDIRALPLETFSQPPVGDADPPTPTGSEPAASNGSSGDVSPPSGVALAGVPSATGSPGSDTGSGSA
jgi:hypothetical protein